MRTTGKSLATALFIPLLATFALGQEDLELVRRVADNYQRLKSFEFTGHLITTLPGTEFQFRTNTRDAEAGQPFLPKHSSRLKYGEAVQYHGGTLRNADGQPAPLDAIKTGFTMPGHWWRDENLASEILSINSLPSQVLKVQNESVTCRVIEIVYDRARWRPEERTIKYWIDADRHLVLKQEFAEWQNWDSDDVLWRWSYVVDSVALNRPLRAG